MGRKLDLAARMKNPWFWIGLVSVALTALGVDPRSLVSWPALASCALDVLRNPVQLATAALRSWRCLPTPPPPACATAPPAAESRREKPGSERAAAAVRKSF